MITPPLTIDRTGDATPSSVRPLFTIPIRVAPSSVPIARP